VTLTDAANLSQIIATFVVLGGLVRRKRR